MGGIVRCGGPARADHARVRTARRRPGSTLQAWCRCAERGAPPFDARPPAGDRSQGSSSLRPTRRRTSTSRSVRPAARGTPRGRGRSLTGCREHRRDRIGVKTAAPGLGEQLISGLVEVERRPMGTSLGHRLQGVRRCQHSCSRTDRRAATPSVVAGSVEAFVMQADDRGHGCQR